MTTDLNQEFDRAEPSNPYNYSKLDLAKKEQSVKAAMRDYPHIPSFYIEKKKGTRSNSFYQSHSGHVLFGTNARDSAQAHVI